MRSNSILRWILVPLGGLIVGIGASLLWFRFTREPLHPDPDRVPSVSYAKPSGRWAEAADKARRIVRSKISRQNLPGLSVAVGAGDSVVWAEGFGWGELRTHAPITPDTRFKIGTASTGITSAAAGVLLEKGRLAVDDEIQKQVPQFPRKPWALTLGQLMADSGGLGSDGGDDGPLFRQRCERPVQALPLFAADALLYEPGTRYRPSKYGWVLVSAAIEAAAGQQFLPFLGQQIFQPLGMTSTGAEPASEENPERIGEEAEDPPIATFIRQVIVEPLGHVAVKPKSPTEPATIYTPGMAPGPLIRYGVRLQRIYNLSCYAGSMAFFSTPGDLVRFGLAMEGGKLLRPETRQLLQTSTRLKSGEETGHGLGWDLDLQTLSGRRTQVVKRDGEMMGQTVASLLIFREAGLVVAVMSNTPYAGLSTLGLNIAEAFAQPSRE
ncbi:MAG: beta-lactamase family protein [Acidobacteria bacterium]|nr:beta-lactamase family protein [Acidobacteriota bacterium]